MAQHTLSHYLKEAKLDAHEKAFAEAEVDLDSFLLLDPKDLKDLGFKGPTRKLLLSLSTKINAIQRGELTEQEFSAFLQSMVEKIKEKEEKKERKREKAERIEKEKVEKAERIEKEKAEKVEKSEKEKTEKSERSEKEKILQRREKKKKRDEKESRKRRSKKEEKDGEKGGEKTGEEEKIEAGESDEKDEEREPDTAQPDEDPENKKRLELKLKLALEALDAMEPEEEDDDDELQTVNPDTDVDGPQKTFIFRMHSDNSERIDEEDEEDEDEDEEDEEGRMDKQLKSPFEVIKYRNKSSNAIKIESVPNLSANEIENPDLTGWLTKQGGMVKNWKRRWFVLKGPCLYYFPSPAKTKAKGMITLPSYKIKYAEEELGRPNSFQAYHPSARTYYFTASTPLEMHNWMVALQKAAYFESEPDSMDPRSPSLKTVNKILSSKITQEVTITRKIHQIIGLDIRVNKDEGTIVTRIHEGSPADECKGIQIGDQVLKVQGKSILGMNIQEVVEILRNLGESFVLTIRRNHYL